MEPMEVMVTGAGLQAFIDSATHPAIKACLLELQQARQQLQSVTEERNTILKAITEHCTVDQVNLITSDVVKARRTNETHTAR